MLRSLGVGRLRSNPGLSAAAPAAGTSGSCTAHLSAERGACTRSNRVGSIATSTLVWTAVSPSLTDAVALNKAPRPMRDFGTGFSQT
eukprot:m.36784 g.36784  ORF g.36784 m.36784 type:complete len:87 (+) comp5440_c0_seq1:499-759(+)